MKKLTVNPGTKSKLPKPVQNLIKMIFDVESMKKAMVEYEVRAPVFGLSLCWGSGRSAALPGFASLPVLEPEVAEVC